MENVIKNLTNQETNLDKIIDSLENLCWNVLDDI